MDRTARWGQPELAVSETWERDPWQWCGQAREQQGFQFKGRLATRPGCGLRHCRSCLILPRLPPHLVSYSALKRDGQRLSTLMKKGEAVEAKPARPVTVYSLSLQKFQPPFFTLGKREKFETICFHVPLSLY